MNDYELKATIFEALENAKKWLPVYQALLRVLPDKEQAIEALKYLIKMEGE